MARGGLGVRHSQADKIAKAQRYRLTAVPAGSMVAECLDKYRRWELGYRIGIIVRNTVTAVTVRWQDEEEFTFYTAADARYKVDTNLWRITPPKQQNIFEAMSQPALTGKPQSESIMPSPPWGGGSLTEEDTMAAATKSKTHKLGTDEKGLPKIVEDNASKPEPQPPTKAAAPKATPKPAPAPAPEAKPKERESYTAKQVATRIGTDAKTLRKFFRSPASTVEAVGQGGRYEFDAADMPKIQQEFEAWKAGKTPRTKKAPGEKAQRRSPRQAPDHAVVIDEDEEILELDDDDEDPSDDDLAEIEDIELDDEELDD